MACGGDTELAVVIGDVCNLECVGSLLPEDYQDFCSQNANVEFLLDGDYRNVELYVGYLDQDNGPDLDCRDPLVLVTPSPTRFPTRSPTKMPTKLPTSEPTPQPTPNPTSSSCQGSNSCCVEEVGLNACNGDNACCPSYVDTVFVSDNSCNFKQACYYNGQKGQVTIEEGSCNGQYACVYIQAGSIGKNACNGYQACAGFESLTVQDGSCNCRDCCNCLPEAALVGPNQCNSPGECC